MVNTTVIGMARSIGRSVVNWRSRALSFLSSAPSTHAF
jgi:hypothetical protein